MKSYCGADCENCGYMKNGACAGCRECGACPFGKKCFVAEYIKAGGREKYDEFKKILIREINGMNVPGMREATELFELNGAYVNLAYPMPNGKTVRFLDDGEIYLGCQLESEFNDGSFQRCYGVVANADFILVAEYGENGSDPELVAYKKR